MNLIIVSPSDYIAEKTVTFSDARFQQIKAIHGSKTGDSVRIGELNGLIGQGLIESIDEQQATLQCDFREPPPDKLPLTIVLALPRPKMIRRIFRTVAELGVSELVIINSYKVEKSFWQSQALESKKVHSYLVDGLQQAKDTVMPKVSFYQLFKPFVEDELPAIANKTKKLIAHPGVTEPCPLAINAPVTLAIGPEGGFTPYEVEKFYEAGFKGIHLGPRILKVENAITVLTAKLFN